MKLLPKLCAGEPSGAATVGNDVGDGLAVHGQSDAFARPDGVNDLTRPVA